MCEREPATTTYGAPVCDDCHLWLTSLDGDLKAMEAVDPALAALGRKIEEAGRKLLDSGDRREA